MARSCGSSDAPCGLHEIAQYALTTLIAPSHYPIRLIYSFSSGSLLLTDVAFHSLYVAVSNQSNNREVFMIITGKLAGGLLSLAGLIAFSMPSFAAESGQSGSGSGERPVDAQTFQQQRSDKTQQGQDLINKQPMAAQQSEPQAGKQSTNTGADLSGGRHGHLGPHDSQGSQMQKKDMKGGGNTGR